MKWYLRCNGYSWKTPWLILEENISREEVPEPHWSMVMSKRILGCLLMEEGAVYSGWYQSGRWTWLVKERQMNNKSEETCQKKVSLWSLFQFLSLVSCLVSLHDGLYSIRWSNPYSILDFVMGFVTTTESKLDHFNNTSHHPCPEKQWDQVGTTAITWLHAYESKKLFHDEGIMLPSHLMLLALFLWLLVAICFKNLMYSLQETKRMKIALLENSKLL